MDAKLSETQANFLSRYYNNLGSIKEALEDLGLDYLHFRQWLNDKYFVIKFDEMKRDVHRFLALDNESIAKRELNNLLHNGIIEIEEITFEEVGLDGQIIKSSTARKVKRKTALDAIKQVFGDKSDEYCINKLAERGILSKVAARKVLSLGNEYQLKIQNCLGDDEKGDKMNDEKAIVLVKQALLGKGEEIQ
jgi:hypothetical protein